jgi:hypothetical protein
LRSSAAHAPRRPHNGQCVIPLTHPHLPAKQNDTMGTRAGKRDAERMRLPFLGLLACAFAITELFAILAAKTLHTIGGRYRDLGESFGWLVFDYGFALEALAVLVAIVAIVVGGPNRRIGFVAIVLVALSFVLLFT